MVRQRAAGSGRGRDSRSPGQRSHQRSPASAYNGARSKVTGGEGGATGAQYEFWGLRIAT